MNFKKGEVFAGYRILGLLGSGSMGQVYLAKHEVLDRTVALKVMSLNPGPGSERFQRFRREVRLHASLSHANLVEVYDGAFEAGCSYLAMEFIRGGTLDDLLKAKGRLDNRSVIIVGLGLAAGLSYLHEKGIVHRDLKPANVLIGRDRAIKIADFGLARDDHGTQLTRANRLLGTPRYMAPEMAWGEPAAEPADVFALGLMLYEMLAGRPAFPHRELSGLLFAVREGKFPPLPDLVPEAPRPLIDLVEACLKLDPEHRLEASAVLARISRIQRTSEGAGGSDCVEDRDADPDADPDVVAEADPDPGADATEGTLEPSHPGGDRFPDPGIGESDPSQARRQRLDTTHIRAIVAANPFFTGAFSLGDSIGDLAGPNRRGLIVLAAMGILLGAVGSVFLFKGAPVDSRASDPGLESLARNPEDVTGTNPSYTANGSVTGMGTGPDSSVPEGRDLPIASSPELKDRDLMMKKFMAHLMMRAPAVHIVTPPGAGDKEQLPKGHRGLLTHVMKGVGALPSPAVRAVFVLVDTGSVSEVTIQVEGRPGTPMAISMMESELAPIILGPDGTGQFDIPRDKVRPGLNIIDVRSDPAPFKLRTRLRRNPRLYLPARKVEPADFGPAQNAVADVLRSGHLWEAEDLAVDYERRHPSEPAALRLHARVLTAYVRGQVESGIVAVGELVAGGAGKSAGMSRSADENLNLQLDLLAKILVLDPGDARAWGQLGIGLGVGGLNAEAWACLEYACLLGYDDNFPWTNFYELYNVFKFTNRSIGRSGQEVLESTRVAAVLARQSFDAFQVRNCNLAIARLEKEIEQRKSQ